MITVMSSQPTDPYFKDRRYWRSVARMARRLNWLVFWLGCSGWLNHQGQVARWINQQVTALGLGLRNLLVIASANASTSDSRQIDLPASSVARPGHQKRGRQFSLTLADFDLPIANRPEQPPTSSLCPESASGQTDTSPEPLSPMAKTMLTPYQRFQAQLDGMADVFADPHPYAVRMARRLRQLGLKARRIATRPRNKTARCIATTGRLGPTYAVPINDSS